MPSDEAGGQAEEGWTPEQKGQGSAGDAGGGDPGEAGDPEPKGRPSDDRAATESAAVEIEQGKSEGQPS
jgi:hypothetical protein